MNTACLVLCRTQASHNCKITPVRLFDIIVSIEDVISSKIDSN